LNEFIAIKEELFSEAVSEFLNPEDITHDNRYKFIKYISEYIEDNLYEMAFEWADKFYSKRSSIDYDGVVENKVHIENDEVLKEM
tara:strand:+ start:41 stop:295 length:255 start_codon:yes stop_codon:yes gene_type:complete